MDKQVRLTKPVRDGLRLLVALAKAATGVDFENASRYAIDEEGREQLRRAEAWIHWTTREGS